MKQLFITILMATLLCPPAFAQKSKHGSKTISGVESVNEYDYLTVDANAGDLSLTVNNSAMNTNNRFAGDLEGGDLLFIVQVQGVSIQNGNGGDFNHGSILDYNNCGQYEFAEVASVPNANTINLSCALSHDYKASGNVVVVRVPRYSDLIIPSGTELTADTWDGEKGGFLIVEVEQGVDLAGTVDMTGKGFRGAPNSTANSGQAGAWGQYATNNSSEAGLKGEGVAGYYGEYDLLDGRYGQGANANAGGGGCSVDAGGGGGANAGLIANYNGKGNPSLVNINYAQAWNQETAGFSLNTSSGGGRGGYSRSSKYVNPYTNPLNDYGIWGADGRRDNATGFGGRPLDYSAGRLFLGGGGGQGFAVDRGLSGGGNGGGLVFLRVEGEITGNGTIVSNGEDGTGLSSNFLTFSNLDGAGGAGAGGTIVLEVQNGIAAINITATGGKGGDVTNNDGFDQNKNFGPGGGGGGGYVKSSFPVAGADVSGGYNGEMFSGTITGVFEPNGATIGGDGQVDVEAASFPSLIAQNDTVCLGETANISVLTANLPGGSTVTWYDDYAEGNIVGTGLTYSNANITSDTTFYVGICPGTFKIPVSIKVQSAVTASVVQDTVSTCSGAPARLEAFGGDTYSWFPSTDLNRTDSSVVQVTTTSNKTIYVEVSIGGSCTDTDSVFVEISPNLSVDLGSNKNICNGDSVTLNATGGTIYTWEDENGVLGNVSSSLIVSPSDTSQYFVTVADGSGCQGEDSVFVNVVPPLEITVPAQQNLCRDEVVSLSASHTGGSGAVTYIWDDGVYFGATQNLSWSVNGSMEVKVIDNTFGCQDSASFPIIVQNVDADFTYEDTCLLSSTAFNASATANGTIVSYDWDFAGASRSGANFDYTFPSSGVNTVELIVTDNAGCADTIIKNITIQNLPLATTSISPDTVCTGYDVIFTNAYVNAPTYSVEWDFGNGTVLQKDSGIMQYSASGSYYVTLTVEDENGCSRSAQDSIIVRDGPVADFTYPTSVKLGTNINLLNTSVGGQIYSWKVYDNEFSNTENALYQSDSLGEKCFELVVIAQSGCKDSITHCIQIEGEELMIPNVFTPNNDGANDNFVLLNTIGKTFDLKVYNRWGVLVFNQTNYSDEWDGKNNSGQDLAAGTYFIMVTEEINGASVVKNGYVYLTR